MNFRVVIESLKFYKLKSDRAVKVWLLLLIMIRAIVTMLPVGDRDFKFVTNILNGEFLQNGELILPTKGNLLIIVLYAVGTFLAICIALLYAEVFILENESKRTDRIRVGSNDIFVVPLKKVSGHDFDDLDQLKDYVKDNIAPSSFRRFSETESTQKLPYLKTALRDLFRFIPGLLALSVLLSMTFIVSSALLMIPFFIVFFILIFTPLNHMYSQNKLARSMELSFAQTNGAKLSMFFSFVIQNFILNLPTNIFLFILADYYYSYLIVDAFFYGIRVFAIARLYALFYQMLAIRQPYSV